MESPKSFKSDYINSIRIYELLVETHRDIEKIAKRLKTEDGQEHADHILKILDTMIDFSSHSAADLEE